MTRVITSYVCPPIPMRAFDWEASIAGREGDEDAPRGWGATEVEAIADLQDQLNDREEAMKYSALKQRTFDDLFSGLALAGMLDRSELLEVATGIRRTEVDGDEQALFLAVAYAIEAYANADAQA